MGGTGLCQMMINDLQKWGLRVRTGWFFLRIGFSRRLPWTWQWIYASCKAITGNKIWVEASVGLERTFFHGVGCSATCLPVCLCYFQPANPHMVRKSYYLTLLCFVRMVFKSIVFRLNLFPYRITGPFVVVDLRCIRCRIPFYATTWNLHWNTTAEWRKCESSFTFKIVSFVFRILKPTASSNNRVRFLKEVINILHNSTIDTLDFIWGTWIRKVRRNGPWLLDCNIVGIFVSGCRIEAQQGHWW